VELRIVCPPGYEPSRAVMEKGERLGGGSARITVAHEPDEALRDTDIIYTDVWASMGQETEQQRRREDFAHLQVNPALLALAPPTARVMHCLPAHRGEEIVDAVIDGPQSIVFDQAENRLWVQMALLASVFDEAAAA
jgi:ornithine carbamoyltransferase